MDRLIQEINAPEIDPEERPSAGDMLEFLTEIGCIEQLQVLGKPHMRITGLGRYTHDYLCHGLTLATAMGRTAEEIEAEQN